MRYLPHSDADRQAMLAAIGVDSIDALFKDVPAAASLSEPVDLPLHAGELEVERRLGKMAARNLSAAAAPFFVGAGAYRHHIPASVDHLIQRGEFLTAYTPYQPEISQGTLQVLFEFQSQVALLTGMDVANASMYDGATATAEAVLMAHRVTRRGKSVLSGGLHPHYRDVVRTALQFTGFELQAAAPDLAVLDDVTAGIDGETSAVVVQTPDVLGRLHDLAPVAAAAHEHGALLIVVVNEVVSLGALKSPGEQGADIVVGEGQSLGNALSFGGPYLGLFSTRQKFVRQMPGRLCGETVDEDGRRGYVLTLAAREQHIRREKATSNICTSAGLCATAFTIHLALLGEEGFRRLAVLNHEAAITLADRVGAVAGVSVINSSFFNEFAVRLNRPAADVVSALADKGILAGVPASRLYPGDPELQDVLLLAASELTTDADIDALCDGLQEVLS